MSLQQELHSSEDYHLKKPIYKINTNNIIYKSGFNCVCVCVCTTRLYRWVVCDNWTEWSAERDCVRILLPPR